ncbi:hypothetical protein L228DRAFT_2087 [Xylona heveae TC161]|uniref:F-box domain-containing protein n=1 Tax=Xylona heveae (strain CBS 132557 / TC161) TaxID=1328760 RepID=A0A165JA91_XYLHT|nr:hypothetical protein L228DRAFT_2087 [Xylona heveae TC161]KZF25963.1 hypothetical protein L228DRAFT_2087 [Xylona heveae TC161]
MDFTNLPFDVVIGIVRLLEFADIARCRRVCASWSKAFSHPELLRDVLLWSVPLAREVKYLKKLEQSGLRSALERRWSEIFQDVAPRWDALKKARPRSTQRISFYRPSASNSPLVYDVAPWHRIDSSRKFFPEFDEADRQWTYSDGFLVFPEPTNGDYLVLDLHSRGILGKVPFLRKGKTVRRIRLNENILAIEWAEEQPFHQLSPLHPEELVHRHFVSIFQLETEPETEDGSQSDSPVRLDVQLRYEWKLHFLGLPLTTRDRFFTVHTGSYYAAYFWQPNRNAWGEDEPIESLIIWDITPAGQAHSDSESPLSSANVHGRDHKDLGDVKNSPTVVKRLNFRDLEFFNVRQGNEPKLKRLDIDKGVIYFREEVKTGLFGNDVTAGLPLHQKFKETITALPVIGNGPIQRKEHDDPDPFFQGGVANYRLLYYASRFRSGFKGISLRNRVSIFVFFSSIRVTG